MDTRDGRIYAFISEEEMKAMNKFQRECLIPMEVPPTMKQMSRKPPKVGRNDPCPCGSGKKFKKCHWSPE